MRFVFSIGDINGIGPEIVIKSIERIIKKSKDDFIIVAPYGLIKETAAQLNSKFNFEHVNSINEISSNSSQLIIIDQKKYRLDTGKPTKTSGEISFNSIIKSYDIVKQGLADAVITAPISKTAWNLAGYNYPGHTELFAELCNSKNFVMMFLSKKMNGSLITIHEPINKVPKLITNKKLERHLKVVKETLTNDLNLKQIKIAVLGLNPHAGENGNIGKEEEEIIKPFIDKNSDLLSGPFPSDAFFANRSEKNYDLVIGMYHDQLLIPFKIMNFTSGVNFTAGLPIVRTSPDHGTAYNIAGKMIADESSMVEAYKYARKIVINRKLNSK
ncbi:MAG: 4-hydroxythreonine-4-phosphate dehydrogenase PdxA [Ignavibacteria bacterium]|nr:4-hydroxythreonine-4-phosphate dehydrogenase PdxA [Ignavibacteria bacterium]